MATFKGKWLGKYSLHGASGTGQQKCNKNRAIFFLAEKTLEQVILLKVTFFGFGVYTPNFVLGLNTLKVEFGIAKGIMILVATGILKAGPLKI